MVLKGEDYGSQINLRFTNYDLQFVHYDLNGIGFWDLEFGTCKDPFVLRTSLQGEKPESLNLETDWGLGTLNLEL